LKKWLCSIVGVLLLLITIANSTSAASSIKVYINGEQKFFPQAPVIENGRTLVPLRGIFEGLGAVVKWDNGTRSITATKEKTNIYLKIGSKDAKVNGKIVKIDVPAKIINGSTMVPIRFVSESLGAEVSWDAKSNVINIHLKNGGYNTNIVGNISGYITWQYNYYIGTKADVGADVALIPTNLKSKGDNELFALTLSAIPQGSDGIYSTEADGYGKYVLDDVPAGEYLLLVQSNNTNSDLTVDQYTISKLKTHFTDQEVEYLTLKLKLKKYYIKTIEIKENKTITESHDFGFTYF
jgi:hypothetical protein